MTYNINKKTLFSREVIFLIVSLIYFHQMLFETFTSSPLEVAYFKTYSVGIPSNYPSIWGYIDIFSKLHAYQAIFAQKIVSLFLLLNSSYFITDLLYQKARNSKRDNQWGFLHKNVLSLLLSFNPIFVIMFPLDDFSTLVFMNFALFFSLELLINRKSKVEFAVFLLAASFFIAYGVIIFPLTFAYYLAVYFFIGFPLAFSFRKMARFFYVIIIELLIFALTYPSLIGLLTASRGSGSTLNSISVFHITNLIYYTINMFSPKSSNTIYSISGLNSLYYVNSLLLAAFLVLFSIILTLFPTRHDFRGLERNIFISFLAIEILNLTVNGQSFVSSLVKYLVQEHILRYNYFGIILTVSTGNELILISYWYVLISLLAVHFARNGAEIDKIKKDTMRVFKTAKQFLVATQLVAIIVVLIILFQIGSSTMISLNDTPSWSYVQSSTSPDYNQYLLFQNSTYFGNRYLFPPSYVTEPTANKFSFYEAVMNSENSPYLAQIDRSYPASTIMLSPSSHSQYLNNAKPLGRDYFLKNFNNSNVIAGAPVFVVGSASSYDSLISNLVDKPVPKSSNVISMRSVPYGLNGSAIPAYDLSLLNSGDFLSFTFNVSINGSDVTPNVGGFLFGMDSNLSSKGGYGNGNNFAGIQATYGNTVFSQIFSADSGFQQNYTGWAIDLSWLNSSVMKYILRYTHFGKNLSLQFRMIEAKVSSSYYIYMDISGMWYSISAYNLFPAEYLTMYDYNEPTKNISMNVNVSAYTINESESRLFPIFYDSPFSGESALINAINSSSSIVFGKNYNIQDLLFSYLLPHSGVHMTEPAAYAIDYPQNGWFQTFSSNSPQGAYYDENINPFLLPINFGYGPSIGYAEDILAGSSLTVPLSHNVNSGDIVGINLLFSPMGGPLKLSVGNCTNTVNTFSNSSFYKWIALNLTGKARTLTFRNEFGVQSVNLIASLSAFLMTSAKFKIGSIVNTKTEIYLGSGYSEHFHSVNAKISGNFDRNNRINMIGATTNQSTTLLLLPTDYSFEFSISVKNATVTEVPVWGYFLGVLLTNHSNGNLTVVITNPSFYSGAVIYAPFLSIVVITAFNTLVLKRRRKI